MADYINELNKQRDAARSSIAQQQSTLESEIKESADTSIQYLNKRLADVKKQTRIAESTIETAKNELREKSEIQQRQQLLPNASRAARIDFTNQLSQLEQLSTGNVIDFTRFKTSVGENITDIKAEEQQRLLELATQTEQAYQSIDSQVAALKQQYSIEVEKAAASGEQIFKDMQASGEIPAEAIYISYDPESGIINYQLNDNRTGEQIFADMQASGDIPANAEYVSFDTETGEINYIIRDIRTGEQIFADMQASGEIPADAIYVGFNAETGELNYQLPDTNTDHQIAVAKAQVDYAKATQDYMNNPTPDNLIRMTEAQKELARIQNDGYYAFVTMQQSGEIPAEAEYVGYNAETGELNYQLPQTELNTALESLIGYKTTNDDGTTGYNLVEYLYDNPSGEQTLLDAGFTPQDIADTKATLADYNANYKRLSTGEWIPLASYTDNNGNNIVGYNDMTPDQQDYINRLGVDRFNSLMDITNAKQSEALDKLADYKTVNEDGTVGYNLVNYILDNNYNTQALIDAGFTLEEINSNKVLAMDYEANYQRLDTGEWIPKNDYTDETGTTYSGFNNLTPEQQTYLQQNGTEAFNVWMTEQQQANYHQLDTGEWIPKESYTDSDGNEILGYNDMTPKMQDYMQKNGIEAYNNLSDIKKYEYFLGREPTLAEWQGYKLSLLDDVYEDQIAAYYATMGIGHATGFIASYIGGEEIPAEKIYKSNLAAQTEWQREYPDQKWIGAIANSFEDLGFPAARAFYKQIAIKDIKASEWIATGISAVLWTLPAVIKGAKGAVVKVSKAKAAVKAAVKTAATKAVPKKIVNAVATVSRQANILQSDIRVGTYNLATKAGTALKNTGISRAITRATAKITVPKLQSTQLTSVNRTLNRASIEKLNTALKDLGTKITSGTKKDVLKATNKVSDMATKLKTSDINTLLKGKGITSLEVKDIVGLTKSIKRESGYIKAFQTELREAKQLSRLKGVYDDIFKLSSKVKSTEPIVNTTEEIIETAPKSTAIMDIAGILRMKGIRGLKGVKVNRWADNVSVDKWGKYNIDEYAERLYDSIGKQVQSGGYKGAIDIYGKSLVKAYAPKALEYAAAEEMFAKQRALSYITTETKGKRIFESMVDTTKPKGTVADIFDEVADQKLLDDIWEQVDKYAAEQAKIVGGKPVTTDDMYLMVKDAYEKARKGMSSITEAESSMGRMVQELTPLEEMQFLGKSLEAPVAEVADDAIRPITSGEAGIKGRFINIMNNIPDLPSMPIINTGAFTSANASIINQQVLNTITPAQLNGIEQLTARQATVIAETYGMTVEQVNQAARAGTLSQTINTTQTESVMLPYANIDAFTSLDTTRIVNPELTNIQQDMIAQSEYVPSRITDTMPMNYEISETIPSKVTDTKVITQEDTIPKPVTETKPITREDTIPRPVTRETTIKATEIKTGKPIRIYVPDLSTEDKKDIENGKKELPIGSVIWRQGKFWKALIPPYKTGDLLNLKEQPMNYDKYATGKGSAKKTVGVVGGVMPDEIDIDYGVMDIKIERGLNNKVYMDYDNKGLDTDYGKSKSSKTKGITVKDKRIKTPNVDNNINIPDRYYLGHKLPETGLEIKL